MTAALSRRGVTRAGRATLINMNIQIFDVTVIGEYRQSICVSNSGWSFEFWLVNVKMGLVGRTDGCMMELEGSYEYNCSLVIECVHWKE